MPLKRILAYMGSEMLIFRVAANWIGKFWFVSVFSTVQNCQNPNFGQFWRAKIQVLVNFSLPKIAKIYIFLPFERLKLQFCKTRIDVSSKKGFVHLYQFFSWNYSWRTLWTRPSQRLHSHCWSRILRKNLDGTSNLGPPFALDAYLRFVPCKWFKKVLSKWEIFASQVYKGWRTEYWPMCGKYVESI